LTSFLNDPDVEIIKSGCLAISEIIASNDTLTNKFLSKWDVSGAVKLLQRGESNVELLAAACKLVSAIAVNEKHQTSMRRKESNVLGELLRLIGVWKNNNIGLASIVSALADLSRNNSKNQDQVYSQELVPNAVAWLTSTSPELQFASSELIGILVAQSKKRKDAFKAANVAAALGPLSKSEHEQVSTGASILADLLKS